MGTKLYVANLPNAPSELALRAHFSACGAVSDVAIVPDRNATGRGRGSALVRMTSAAGAARAISELNGAPFAGQLLQVEAAPDDRREGRASTNGKAAAEGDPATHAHITLQFREPANMTYELDCSGIAVVIRIFFPTADGLWRVAAQASRAPDAVPGSSAAATSRGDAFHSVAGACREGVESGALARVDWEAVENALRKVRAL